jgi:hypothetical protein
MIAAKIAHTCLIVVFVGTSRDQQSGPLCHQTDAGPKTAPAKDWLGPQKRLCSGNAQDA